MIVPHFFQSSEQTCGAACLRMLGAALGVAQNEATIAQYCGITELGCTVQDLVIGAHAMGLQAEMLPVFSWSAAIETLVQHAPFVAMIDLASLYGITPLFQWHFVVPLTLQNDVVMFHDPADGPDRRVSRDDFLAAWATAGYRGVRVWIP
jgi:ABC-type bacteriocin/lantibiotic exporter with double-glycine peptidase domain